MSIAKFIINYTKSGYDIKSSVKYTTHKEIQDDMDYIKQFGDIPSVRRCCKLLVLDPAFNNISFNPLISPQVQKLIEEKTISKQSRMAILKVRFATAENPIVVVFD